MWCFVFASMRQCSSNVGSQRGNKRRSYRFDCVGLPTAVHAGSVPAELGRLTKLESLRLNFNELTGKGGTGEISEVCGTVVDLQYPRRTVQLIVDSDGRPCSRLNRLTAGYSWFGFLRVKVAAWRFQSALGGD